jgi:hypothetical protein
VSKRDDDWVVGETLLEQAFGTGRPEMGTMLAALAKFGPLRVDTELLQTGRTQYTIARLRADAQEEPIPKTIRLRMQTRNATSHKVARAERRATRALQLQRQGYTRRQIGELIASEEQLDFAFPEDTVKSWLRRARRAQPSSPTT